MYKFLPLVLMLLLCVKTTKAQGVDGLWRTLAKVAYSKKYSEELMDNILVPQFGAEVLALEGKEVIISGHVMPLEIGEKYFVLSAFPFSSCYFCGKAGPETVMEIYTKKTFKLSTPTVRLKGKLKLNKTDINHLFYMLKDAEIITK